MAQPSNHWLKAEYLKIAATLLIVAYPVTFFGWYALPTDQVTSNGTPFGSDFITFWASSYLALGGEAAAAFNSTRIFWAEKIAVPANEGIFLWHYPPTFQLFILPLALLPYLAAYFLWTLSTLAALVAIVRRLAPSTYALPLLLTFSGTYLNFFHGQNGFLTAALLGGAMLLLTRQPIAAGILIGLMSYKPQFGLLIPIALLCGRHWTAFAWAALTTIILAVLSWASLGSEAWIAFWNNIPAVQGFLADGRIPWAKSTSVFVALRTLGVDVSYAYAGQFMVAAFVAVTVAWIWRQNPGGPRAIAVLIAGIPLTTPYVFDYDLVMLAPAIALLAWDGVTRGWCRGEREILVLAFFTPAFVSLVAYATEIQIGPLCLIALFAIATRRALWGPEFAGAARPLPAPASS